MSLHSHRRPLPGELSTLWQDSFFCVLALLALLQATFLSAHLVYPDLNLDYPFMDGDSWDWIANGLRLAGNDVRGSGRAPLLPLVIALLEWSALLAWLPVLLQILFHGTVLAFYSLAARLTSRGAAFAAALALMVNPTLLGISLQVMADLPASCLLFLAVRSFLKAKYVEAGVIGGLAAATQPIGLLLALPAALTIALRRRIDFRSRALWIGAAAFAAPPALWAAIHRAQDSDIPARQLQLLAPHFGSLPFYAHAFVELLGWQGVVLLLVGLGLAVWDAWRGGDAPLFVAVLFGVLTGFFVFLYTYEAERFLVYPIWIAGLLIAGTLARLPRTPLIAAALLLIAGAGLPASIYREVLRDRPSSPRFDPAIVEQDRSALYLYQQPSDGGGRYRVITRIGNALRKKVKYVPASWLEPWWQELDLTPLGAIEGDRVWRARLPHLDGSWVIVAPDGKGNGRREIGDGLRQAQRISSSLKSWDGYVALVPGETPEPWQLYLPFLIETTELYVPRPGEEREILKIFAAAPNLGERRIGQVIVRRAELLGRRASLVRGLKRRN